MKQKTENRLQSKSSNMWYDTESSWVALSHAGRWLRSSSMAMSPRTISIASFCIDDVGRKRSNACNALSLSILFVLPTKLSLFSIVYNSKSCVRFMHPNESNYHLYCSQTKSLEHRKYVGKQPSATSPLFFDNLHLDKSPKVSTTNPGWNFWRFVQNGDCRKNGD